MPSAVRDSVAGGSAVVVARRQRRGRLAERGGADSEPPDHGGAQVLSARRDRIPQLQPGEKTLLAR